MEYAFRILSDSKDRVPKQAGDSIMPASFTIPQIDISKEEFRQVIVDRQENVYLGHVTSVLLERKGCCNKLRRI